MGPYSDALLPLKSVEYINASPIDNLGAGSLPFVATMCPKKETFAHFWSMVWEQGSSIIINLTHERDRVGSGPSDKRERYWPPLDPISEKQSSKWPVRPLTLATESCEQVPSLLRFTIELHGPVPADGSARPTRTVYLYWYSRWVDFPSSSSIGARPFYANAWAVLHIALYVLDQLEAIGPGHWAICHCSAGVGRTGTFLALLHVLRLLPTLTSEAELDAAVTTTIEAMRERRLWMVRAAPPAAPLLPPPFPAPPPPHHHHGPNHGACPSCYTHTHSPLSFRILSCRPPLPPLPPRCPLGLQVKTDIEYATLYAALLLRLRNPDNSDFALTWPLKEGSLSRERAMDGGLADLMRVTPTRTAPGDAAEMAASLAAGSRGGALGSLGGGGGQGEGSSSSSRVGGDASGGASAGAPSYKPNVIAAMPRQRPQREQRQALAAHLEETDPVEIDDGTVAGDSVNAAGGAAGDASARTDGARAEGSEESIDNEADVAMYAGVGADSGTTGGAQ